VLLLHLSDIDEHEWVARFRASLDDYPIVRRGDDFDPSKIDYIFVWKPAPDAFDGLTGLKAILSLGSGVDALLAHPRLPDLPIARFVDDSLSQGMSDFVVAQVSMHQRLHTRYRADQKTRVWSQTYPAPACDISVGIMGLGVLGRDALASLHPLGYELRGWSRSAKTIEGVKCFAGNDQFDEFLSGTDILVCLLPLTPETTGILNAANFTKLRRDRLKGGPVIINAARGGHQVEADIVAALEDGTLGAASLDVFQTEPLPKHSPLWNLPNCYVTPHIAAISPPDSGARYFGRVIRDHEAGGPLPHVVDRARGY
jgi:glyoxylate/hydroxypyruvate reductase A